jgi:mannose/cellobiose epimerase-like protein (N-acyl-D-glucosamine 2-epimerase family)
MTQIDLNQITGAEGKPVRRGGQGGFIRPALMLFCGLLLMSSYRPLQSGQRFGDAEYWKRQALEQMAPYWDRYACDQTNGAFFTALSRQWEPKAPWDKYPAMISRQVFGFSAAYLLSGEEQYLDKARAGVNYLMQHAWDQQYGGWFDVLTPAGEPKESSKTVPYQLYTDVGLTLYYFVTGDESVLARIKESIRIRQTRAHDAEWGGYVHALHRDLTVKDDAKSKHSHFGYTSSLLLPLYLATRDPEVLRFAEELMRLSAQRMMDPDQGWVRGFPTPLRRDWTPTPTGRDTPERVSPGAQLTATLAYLRLSQITGNDVYRQQGTRLAESITRAAWDPQRGGWCDAINREPPYAPPEPVRVSWWVQCYGMFAQLQLYHLTGDKSYLDQFNQMASFWNEHFLDKEFGGVWPTVSAAGDPVDTDKAAPWKTSYHEMELGLLNYLYLKLYVNRAAATIHFHVRKDKAGSKHFVSLLEDPAVRITAVTVNGQASSDYNAQERSVLAPAGSARIAVTLSPPAR